MDETGDIVALMQARPGSIYRELDTGVLQAMVDCALQSENWIAIRATDKTLWGWIAWNHVDQSSLSALQELTLFGCIAQGIPLNPGPHIYISHCITSQDAQPLTYRALYGSVVNCNPKALTINAHLINRRGRIRWFSRPGKKGD